MKIKLLNLELTVDETGENFEIIAYYGSILDNEEFKELKEQINSIKDNFEKNVKNVIEGSE